MELLQIDGVQFKAERIELPSAPLLVIQGDKGFLGCGYLNVETAEKLGDALAVVSGVRSFDDMLAARVCKLSSAAEKSGVAIGMTGRDALLRLKE